jgi:diguanylate cyclase (GGDEF)-like protein
LLNDGVLRFGLLDLRRVLRHKVVEELSDGIIIVSHSGRVIDINPSAMRTLGVNDGDALNRNATSLIPSPAIPDMLNQRRTSCEITLLEGSYHVIATPLASEDDGRRQIALVFRDITDRRDQELQLKRVKNRMERLAQTDSLTGLHNRRYFMRRLSEEVERVKRQGYTLSVLLIDLDYFKHVNDTHGHNVGDRVLRVIANVCDEVKRVTDVCSRIGGEEFAILLPDTEGPGALKLAQRLRDTISNQFIAAAAEDAPPIRVTASIGVATVSRHSPYLEHVLSQADQALYQAKNEGRNTVCVAA